MHGTWWCRWGARPTQSKSNGETLVRVSPYIWSRKIYLIILCSEPSCLSACNLEFYRSSTTKSTPIRMRNRDLHLMCFPEDPSVTGSCKLNSIKHILTYPQSEPNHGGSLLAIFYHQAQLYIHTSAFVSKPGWQSRAVLAISIECHPAEFDILSLVVAQRQGGKISPRSHWVLNKPYT